MGLETGFGREEKTDAAEEGVDLPRRGKRGLSSVAGLGRYSRNYPVDDAAGGWRDGADRSFPTAARSRFSFLVVIVTALAVFLAIRVGWNSVRNATIFFLTEENRFFALDARFLFAQRRDILGQVKGMAETKQFLRILSQKPYLPAGADELIAVKKIKENRRYYAVHCRVRHPNRRVADRLYYVVKGYEDEPELLRQLEQRQTDLELPELQESRMPHYILLSAVCCVVLICVCVFSHPAFGVLPQLVYFPCLAAVTVAVFFLLYFILRYRRGE